MKDYKESFWDKVQRQKRGCWIWAAGRFEKGYGQFRNKRANRVAWEIVIGKIPKGLQVLHRCDNPPCVRPSHLFLGTQLDNIRDMRRKGRDNYVRGTKIGTAKLSENAVLRIRKAVGTNKCVANLFGISSSTVSLIKTGKRWGHL